MSESKESCRGRGKLKATQCYARRFGHGVKRRLERFSDYTHRQSGEHRLAFAVAVLLVAGTLVGFGAAFLFQGIVSNPTAAQANYTRTYTFSNGTVVKDNGQITGILKCVVQPSAGAITESSTWVVIGLGYWQTSRVTPYWIQNMWLRVFSGTSASGTPVMRIGLMVDSTTYQNTMQTWATNYWNTIIADPLTGSWYLGETPLANPTWSTTLDTRSLPNGVYTFQVVVAWGLGAIPSAVTSMVTGIPVLPPSLSSSSGEACFLSFFGVGADVPVEVQLPIVFIVIIVVTVAVVLYLRRR